MSRPPPIDATAYPLCWPLGVPRTPAAHRQRAMFGKYRRREGHTFTRRDRLTLGEGLNRIRDELERSAILLRGGGAVISTNLRIRRADGHPMAAQRAPDDPGAAVYLRIAGDARCIPCDRWDRVQDNLAAIAAALEALRGLDRWVNDHACRAVFEGFALPAPGDEARAPSWREVLELDKVAAEKITREVVIARHRQFIRDAHPDRGGSPEAAATINRARDEALAELG